MYSNNSPRQFHKGYCQEKVLASKCFLNPSYSFLQWLPTTCSTNWVSLSWYGVPYSREGFLLLSRLPQSPSPARSRWQGQTDTIPKEVTQEEVRLIQRQSRGNVDRHCPALLNGDSCLGMECTTRPLCDCMSTSITSFGMVSSPPWHLLPAGLSGWGNLFRCIKVAMGGEPFQVRDALFGNRNYL